MKRANVMILFPLEMKKKLVSTEILGLVVVL